MKASFRNISSIMDCVACEKCKMWAKLDILGLATALKINLDGDNVFSSLQRNEIIALVNAFKQHSQSIYNFHEMLAYHQRKSIAPKIAIGFGVLVGSLILAFVLKNLFPKQEKGKKE
ncbi:hypothetical protein C9374_004649 [Naegleria lovaniensis]|uniref:Uncharacterized protein n=1 Tax=Naegleria lovaniensis TaxID=51637 RepID=A0AA88KJK0_NAELO|nr:uncharacterized protein C9374_004649 [Naegleria lovaniensis]KAG2383312.1 hypothetical protein C9374_004649 [Naegleria lovaniensis]